MVWKRIAFLAAVFATTSVHAFDLQGFKQVKFGASREDVEALGYGCKSDAEGRLECSGEDTLFGIPARVRIWFKDGRANSMRVMPMDSKPIDLVTAYTKALGKPKQYTDSTRKSPLTVSYWIAANGASVSTFASKDLGPILNPTTGEERHFANADYMDKLATQKLLAEAKKVGRQQSDF